MPRFALGSRDSKSHKRICEHQRVDPIKSLNQLIFSGLLQAIVPFLHLVALKELSYQEKGPAKLIRKFLEDGSENFHIELNNLLQSRAKIC